MIDRRIAIAFTFIYAAVLGALVIANLMVAFVVVAVIGGSTTSLLYWLAAKQPEE